MLLNHEIEVKSHNGGKQKLGEESEGSVRSIMKPVDLRFFYVDNYRYPAGKELFDKVNTGDEVYVHISPLLFPLSSPFKYLS